jgi:hypothetical protein
VSTVNKLLTEYVPIDVTGGTLDVFSEMALQNKHAIGYAKIFLSDGNIIAVKQEYKNLKHLFFELSSAFGNRILKNSNSNSLATRIPFEFKAGRLNLKMDQALNSILENRDEKLLKGFENSISFKSL